LRDALAHAGDLGFQAGDARFVFVALKVGLRRER
jgi:hypothetical protein